MAEAINAKDWSATPIGRRDGWPHELRCILALILDTKFPHFIAWGGELTLLFNDAFAEMTRNPEAALGARLEDYYADLWATVGPIARTAMTGTSSFFEDLPIRAQRDGRWEQSWWTFAYSPIRLQDGSVGGVFCTATDTTQHKMLEHRQQENEKSLRRFTDLVPNFLWEADAHGRMHYLNRRMLAYTGLTAQAQVPDWTVLAHPDDIVHIVAAYAEAQAKQGSFECQHRFRAADGSYRWFLAKAQPVFDEEGGVAGWYGCATDIHNWRLTVDELKKSENLVRRFAENAARILWIADLKTGTVEYLNAAGRAYWDGQAEREIESWEDWFGIIHPAHQTTVVNAIDRLRVGETVGGVYRVADGGGTYCDLRTTLFPIMEPDGRLTKFGGIAEIIAAKHRRLVHLVDPDRDAHRRLSAQLWAHGYEVRGFTDVHAFTKVAPALLAGCVIVRSTDHSGWVGRVVNAARQQDGRLRVIVLSDGHGEADYVRTLMKQGAADVLSHDPEWSDLAAAIDEVTRDLDVPEAAAQRSVAANAPAPSADPRGQRIGALSAREREILERLTIGATNKVVALELGISPRTVEAHRARIFEKLGVSTLAEAVAITVKVSPR